MADFQNEDSAKLASVNTLDDNSIDFDDTNLGLEQSQFAKCRGPYEESLNPFLSQQLSTTTEHRDYDASAQDDVSAHYDAYVHSDAHASQSHFHDGSELSAKDASHSGSFHYGENDDSPADFTEEVSGFHDPTASDCLGNMSTVMAINGGRGDNAEEMIQEDDNSNPFITDLTNQGTAVPSESFSGRDGSIGGYNPFSCEEGADMLMETKEFDHQDVLHNELDYFHEHRFEETNSSFEEKHSGEVGITPAYRRLEEEEEDDEDEDEDDADIQMEPVGNVQHPPEVAGIGQENVANEQPAENYGIMDHAEEIPLPPAAPAHGYENAECERDVEQNEPAPEMQHFSATCFGHQLNMETDSFENTEAHEFLNLQPGDLSFEKHTDSEDEQKEDLENMPPASKQNEVQAVNQRLSTDTDKEYEEHIVSTEKEFVQSEVPVMEPVDFISEQHDDDDRDVKEQQKSEKEFVQSEVPVMEPADFISEQHDDDVRDVKEQQKSEKEFVQSEVSVMEPVDFISEQHDDDVRDVKEQQKSEKEFVQSEVSVMEPVDFISEQHDDGVRDVKEQQKSEKEFVQSKVSVMEPFDFISEQHDDGVRDVKEQQKSEKEFVQSEVSVMEPVDFVSEQHDDGVRDVKEQQKSEKEFVQSKVSVMEPFDFISEQHDDGVRDVKEQQKSEKEFVQSEVSVMEPVDFVSEQHDDGVRDVKEQQKSEKEFVQSEVSVMEPFDFISEQHDDGVRDVKEQQKSEKEFVQSKVSVMEPFDFISEQHDDGVRDVKEQQKSEKEFVQSEVSVMEPFDFISEQHDDGVRDVKEQQKSEKEFVQSEVSVMEPVDFISEQHDDDVRDVKEQQKSEETENDAVQNINQRCPMETEEAYEEQIVSNEEEFLQIEVPEIVAVSEQHDDDMREENDIKEEKKEQKSEHTEDDNIQNVNQIFPTDMQEIVEQVHSKEDEIVQNEPFDAMAVNFSVEHDENDMTEDEEEYGEEEDEESYQQSKQTEHDDIQIINQRLPTNIQEVDEEKIVFKGKEFVQCEISITEAANFVSEENDAEEVKEEKEEQQTEEIKNDGMQNVNQRFSKDMEEMLEKQVDLKEEEGIESEPAAMTAVNFSSEQGESDVREEEREHPVKQTDDEIMNRFSDNLDYVEEEHTILQEENDVQSKVFLEEKVTGQDNDTKEEITVQQSKKEEEVCIYAKEEHDEREKPFEESEEKNISTSCEFSHVEPPISTREIKSLDQLRSYEKDKEEFGSHSEKGFTSNIDSDLLSSEYEDRSFVDNLSELTSPDTIPQPLPSPPEPKDMSSFDPLASSDSLSPCHETNQNLGQNGELFEYGASTEVNNTTNFLTSGEVEGETKFGVDGTAVTSTAQNNVFLNSDDEAEEDEEESQNLDHGGLTVTGATETETSIDEKSGEYGGQDYDQSAVTDNALMSMSMEGSFYDDGGELFGGEDRRSQEDGHLYGGDDENSQHERFEPKQEDYIVNKDEFGQKVLKDFNQDQKTYVSHHEDTFQVQENEDISGHLPSSADTSVSVMNGVCDESHAGDISSLLDAPISEKDLQTSFVEQTESDVDSNVDKTDTEVISHESRQNLDQDGLIVTEATETETSIPDDKALKDSEVALEGSRISGTVPEKEEPSSADTAVADKEKQYGTVPEAATATAVGSAVAVATSAQEVTKTTTTMKKTTSKVSGKTATTTTTTATKVTKETKTSSGKAATTKKAETTSAATSKAAPKKPTDSRPTSATTSEKKTSAKAATSPSKSAVPPATVKSAAPLPSYAQPIVPRKPREAKLPSPEEKKKLSTSRSSSATPHTPRPQSASATASSTITTTKTVTKTSVTAVSGTSRPTELARPKSSPTKLTNGVTHPPADTKSPTKKYGIDSKNEGYKPGGGNVKITTEKKEYKATSKIDVGSKSGKAVTKSPTKQSSPKLKSGTSDSTTSSPGDGKTKPIAKKPDYANVTSKIGSKDNIDHKPGGGRVKIEYKKMKIEAKSRIGSLENATYKPGGGDKKIEVQKTEWKAQSKVGSFDNAKHKPGGKQGDAKDKATKNGSVEKPGPGSGSEQGVTELHNGSASEI